MNITLEVKGADLSKEVGGILAELTPEEKKQMAKDIMLTWLKEPVNFERKIREHQAFERAKEKLSNSSSSYDRERAKTDEGIRGTSEYNDQLRNWKSTKEVMVEMIITETVTLYKSHVVELLKTDQQLKDIWEKLKPVLVENFPKYAHDSMTYFFAEQMSHIASTLQQTLMSGVNREHSLNEIRSAIGLPMRS